MINNLLLRKRMKVLNVASFIILGVLVLFCCQAYLFDVKFALQGVYVMKFVFEFVLATFIIIDLQRIGIVIVDKIFDSKKNNEWLNEEDSLEKISEELEEENLED